MSSVLFEEEESCYKIEKTSKTDIELVSVLKHISKPLFILNKQSPYHMPEPQCVYPQKIEELSESIFPTTENTNKQQGLQTKLFKMQNAQLEYDEVRKNFLKEVSQPTDCGYKAETQQNQKMKLKTLFGRYGKKQPYYCRFEEHMVRKSNFANVLVPVNGISLESQNRYKAKAGASQRLNCEKGSFGRPYNSGCLVFDSRFQSANLLYAYESKSEADCLCYDLLMQNDTNTYGHNQWFFFKALCQKSHQTVRFNLINFIKNDSLFNYGLKPLTFSESDHKKHSVGWVRAGNHIRYFPNDLRREHKDAYYFTMTFEYTFKNAKDWVYFAPSYPYTYKQMATFVQSLCIQPTYQNCFSIKSLAQTTGNNSVNLITIATGRKTIEECKVIWILARQHSTETTSSFMIEGILKYLLPLVSAAKNQNAPDLEQLHNFVWKIVPMVNVDGVVHGNSRTGLVGLDPNRSWKRPKKKITPEVAQISKEIQSYKLNTSLVLDLHSHSKKTGCFFYGNQLCHNPKASKIYPALVCQNDQRFCLKNCRFRGGYKTTARCVLFESLKIENIFTVECSLLGYMRNNRIVEYSVQDYNEMGVKLVQNYLRLEKVRLSGAILELIREYSSVTDQICEVDEAKSDSSLSDEEYEEMKQLERNLIRKKKRVSTHLKSVQVESRSRKAKVADHKDDEAAQTKRTCSLIRQHDRNRSFKICSSKGKDSAALLKKEIADKLKSKSYYAEEPRSLGANFISQPEEQGEKRKLNNVKVRVKRPYINNQAKHIRVNTESFDDVKRQQIGTQANQEEILSSQNLQAHSSKNVLKQRTKLLCVQGNPVHNDLTLHENSEVSIQVCVTEKQQVRLGGLMTQNRILGKLPKLVAQMAEKNNKVRRGSFKENSYSFVEEKRMSTLK